MVQEDLAGLVVPAVPADLKDQLLQVALENLVDQEALEDQRDQGDLADLVVQVVQVDHCPQAVQEDLKGQEDLVVLEDLMVRLHREGLGNLVDQVELEVRVGLEDLEVQVDPVDRVDRVDQVDLEYLEYLVLQVQAVFLVYLAELNYSTLPS